MRGLRALAAALTVAVCVASCGSGDSAGGDGGSGPVTVKVGVLPIAAVAPLYLGMEQGFFSDEGIRIKPVVAQGGSAVLTSVVAGELQFGFSNTVSLMLAREKGLPVKVVTQASQGARDDRGDFAAVIVKRDSAARRLADLEGKTIGVNALQNIGDLAIRYSLKRAGVDPSKVKFTEIPFPEMNAALEADRVDAVWQEEPFLSQATADGARALVYHYPRVAPGLTVATYFTGERTISDEPDVVRGFAAAMNKSLDYANRHEAAARRVIIKHTKVDRRTAQNMRLPTWSSDLNVPSIKKIGAIGRDQGLFDSRPDLEGLVFKP